MFDECAGNFKHKRLKAVVWLFVVVAFFVVVRQLYISKLNRAQETQVVHESQIQVHESEIQE